MFGRGVTKVDEHGLGAVEIIFDQVRVQPGVTCPSGRRNGFLVVPVEGSQKKLWRARDRPDAMPRKAVLPADLPALQSIVAGEKMLAKRMPFVEDHRETTIDLAQPAANAQQRQRRGDRPAFKSGIAMPPGIPALSLTNHSFSVDETSRIVCITVGAQWPILRRLARPRPR